MFFLFWWGLVVLYLDFMVGYGGYGFCCGWYVVDDGFYYWGLDVFVCVGVGIGVG